MTNEPHRVQLRRTKGWRMPPNTVKVARPGLWGNPYPVAEFGRELALELFASTVRGVWRPQTLKGKPDDVVARAYELHTGFLRRHAGDPEGNARRMLAGSNLACFCAPDEACHVDILLPLANP
jgi:hypothetical protein